MDYENNNPISEGDFVMGSTSEGIVHGVVEHIMVEGGIYGTPGTEYAIESMPPENPAMAVRIYREESGTWKPTAYSIGMMYQDATKTDMENHTMNSEKSMDTPDYETEKAYADCGCSTCKAMDVTCKDCPDCQGNAMKSDCCPDEGLEKQAPCWDGYVQRGMKPGKDGKPVPNCVPAEKSDSLDNDDDSVFANFGKDYTKSRAVDLNL